MLESERDSVIRLHNDTTWLFKGVLISCKNEQRALVAALITCGDLFLNERKIILLAVLIDERMKLVNRRRKISNKYRDEIMSVSVLVENHVWT